ncbi:dTDP-4-dehydrorhamnose 3,5-epimerase [Shewanella goraebulensis]|uniref:dTDP-4-dehydrorhamnose 3,5-epimerase n=1 Tax=Shewanella goraebulensis TaxID=3050637 RepID=UPI00254C6297|nr:dTDP-4-dehydrorhamnose 3,5-epimerase [Shewanella goraebulensis]
MKFIETGIPDVKIIEPQVFRDDRGYFLETFRQDLFDENIGQTIFVQENQSRSSKGTLRGLHYQTSNTQGKLVRVTRGEVFDVAVDMRQDSLSFGKWVGVILSEQNMRQLWVPPGFAHGFYVTSEIADLAYKCTDKYNSEAEISVLWNDKDIKIEWPFCENIELTLSDKDKKGSSFKQAPKFKGYFCG